MQTMTQATQSVFHAVRDELKTVLIERDEQITNAMLALVSGEHYLQLGEPGIAKSLLVRELCARIAGANYFEKLLNETTEPDELFGPIDLARYADQGERVRLTNGTIAGAHIGFLDEIYKANSVILNSMLGVLNERIYHEPGFDPVRLPLLSVFAASNETPAESGLEALDDRLILREVVHKIQDESNFVRMLTMGETSANAYMTLDDIRQAQEEASHIKGTPETMAAILKIRTALSQAGVSVTDRRWKKSLKVIKAAVWLDERTETEVEDLTVLRHTLWTDPKDSKTVERTVYEIANPLYVGALEMEDMAQELYSALPAEDNPDYQPQLENTLQQIADIYHRLHSDISASNARNTTRAQASLATIATLHQKLSESALKKVARFKL